MYMGILFVVEILRLFPLLWLSWHPERNFLNFWFVSRLKLVAHEDTLDGNTIRQRGASELFVVSASSFCLKLLLVCLSATSFSVKWGWTRLKYLNQRVVPFHESVRPANKLAYQPSSLRHVGGPLEAFLSSFKPHYHQKRVAHLRQSPEGRIALWRTSSNGQETRRTYSGLSEVGSQLLILPILIIR